MATSNLRKRIADLELCAQSEEGAAVMIPFENESHQGYWQRIDNMIASGRQVLLIPRKGAAPCTVKHFLDLVTAGNKGLNGVIEHNHAGACDEG